MALNAEQKAAIVNDYKVGEGDSGSPEVQVALLTANIEQLQVTSSRTSTTITHAAA